MLGGVIAGIACYCGYMLVLYLKGDVNPNTGQLVVPGLRLVFLGVLLVYGLGILISAMVQSRNGLWDKSDLDNAIVSLPLERGRAWRRTIRVAGLALCTLLVVGVFAKVSMEGKPRSQQDPLLVSGGLVVWGVSIFSELIRRAWSRPLVIHNSGFRVEGRRVSWERVVSCRWGLCKPAELNIRARHAFFTVLVPEGYREQIEATLREFGKWEEPADSSRAFAGQS